MNRRIATMALLAALAGCAEPVRLEAAWYLQVKPGQVAGDDEQLLIAIRNRAEHSQAIYALTLDPVNTPGGYRGWLPLDKTAVLAPGQLLVVDISEFRYIGEPWAERWPWRPPVDAGPRQDTRCAAPLHLKAKLADGRSHGVPMSDGMPSTLGRTWLDHCLVHGQAASATSAAASR